MDIRELLDSVQLTDVRMIEREGHLKLDPTPGVGLAAAPTDVDGGEISIELRPMAWGQHIEVWFRIILDREDVRITAAAATLFSRESEDEVPEDVRVEFIEKVAVMAAYPYLRADVQNMAADLRIGSVTLDLLRQGQFRVGASVSDDTDGSDE